MMGLNRPEVRALLALGAESVTEEENGAISHLPEDLDLSGYAAALAAATAAIAAEAKTRLIAFAADLRWQREQAGGSWNGWPLHTDDRSQGKILSELQAIAQGVRLDGDGWKFADGQFRPVSNADFPALAIAAREHVRNLFVIEAGVLMAIEAGTISTVEEIEAAFEVTP